MITPWRNAPDRTTPLSAENLQAAFDEKLDRTEASATYVSAEIDATGGVTLYLNGVEL